MSQITANETDRSEDARSTRMQKLLLRYPDMTEDELREVKDFLTCGPILAVGRVTGDEAVKTQLEAFWRDHPALNKPSPFQYAVIAMATIVGLALVGFLLWDMGI